VKNEYEVDKMNSVSSEIKRFAHNIGQNWYHVVLVTKKRGKIFQWKETKELADKAFDWICDRHNIDLFTKEVMPDHVHLFVSCPPELSIRKLFQTLKGGQLLLHKEKLPFLKEIQAHLG